MTPTLDDRRDRETEPTGNYTSMYVIEEGSNELIEAVYEADDLVVPETGDRISFIEATVEGDLEERSARYRERDAETPAYVVERRDVNYLHVDYDVDRSDQRHGTVSEVRLWVREVSDENSS